MKNTIGCWNGEEIRRVCFVRLRICCVHPMTSHVSPIQPYTEPNPLEMESLKELRLYSVVPRPRIDSWHSNLLFDFQVTYNQCIIPKSGKPPSQFRPLEKTLLTIIVTPSFFASENILLLGIAGCLQPTARFKQSGAQSTGIRLT